MLSRRDTRHLIPKRSCLIWKYTRPQLGPIGGILLVVPFGTDYFRVLQQVLKTLGPGALRRAGLYQVRPRTLQLGPLAAQTWELMNGRNTVRSIAAAVADGRFGRREWWDEVELVAFLERAHRMGLINLDHPRPPLEGYEPLIAEALDGGILEGLLPDPGVRSEVLAVMRTRQEALFSATMATRP